MCESGLLIYHAPDVFFVINDIFKEYVVFNDRMVCKYQTVLGRRQTRSLRYCPGVCLVCLKKPTNMSQARLEFGTSHI